MSQALQPAYILHHYPYQSHGVLLKLLTEQGLVTAIAKGAKRPRSSWYGLVRPFVPLQFSYSGRGQVKSVRQLEAASHPETLGQLGLLSGFYMNELLLHFLQPEDAHPVLFNAYHVCLSALSQADQIELALRQFEWALFNALGYVPSLHEDTSGQSILPDQIYQLLPGNLPVKLMNANIDPAGRDQYPGAVLFAIARGELGDTVVKRYAKYLFRHWLDFYLEGKVLKSRQLLRDFYRNLNEG